MDLPQLGAFGQKKNVANTGDLVAQKKAVRTLQTESMVKLNPDKDWSFIQRQIGMFSYTGLSKDQVQKCMTDKHRIYMTMAGAVAC